MYILLLGNSAYLGTGNQGKTVMEAVMKMAVSNTEQRNKKANSHHRKSFFMIHLHKNGGENPLNQKDLCRNRTL